MCILHFVKRFSPTSETFIYDYITELERRGTDNHVATLRHTNKDVRPFPDVTQLKIPSRWDPRRLWQFGRHVFTKDYSVERARVTSTWPQIRDQLATIVRHVEPDVIHAHFGPAGILIAPIAKRSGVPLALTLYGHDVSRLIQDKFWRDRYPPTFEKASLLVGISRHICSRVESLGGDPDKITCWHLGIDLDQFEYRPADASFDGKTVRCLHVGRLVEKKSPIDLARAFKYAVDVVNSDTRLKLTIAGDGPLRADLEREVQKLGIENHVSILGEVAHSRVSDLLADANLYTQHCKTASDGDQEGQGVSFVEAAASGLPIVSTRHNGLTDVILDGETGYLVGEGDFEAMGEKIAWLAERPSQWCRLGRAGRRHVEENFNLQDQVCEIQEILSHLTER